MKHLPPLLASSAIALALVAVPALAQDTMGPAGTRATPPAGTTNASLTGGQKIPVSNIPSAQQIKGAPVLDSSGKQFGRVVDVKMTDGKPDKVKVGFTTSDAMGRVASINATKLVLDPSKQAIVADLSPAELTQLAASASSMGGAGTSGTAAGGGGSSSAGKGQN